MNILEQIIQSKKTEVEQRREHYPIAQLEQSHYFNRNNLSLKEFLTRTDKSGIIAEFKRRSPSRGIINNNVLLSEVVKGYEQAGASAVSVLTDTPFFGGENKDLAEARAILQIPILRKDFVIDEYQIVEAKAIGADAILLIAAALPAVRLQELASFARYLHLEVLMEVHNKEELLNNLHPEVDVIGVNNRNLKDFSESIETSITLAALIPDRYLKISESSISKAATIKQLKQHGYNGFLIGETFMKTSDPGAACSQLAKEVESMMQTK